MKKIPGLLLICLFVPAFVFAEYSASEPRTWNKYPPEVQKRGFGMHKMETAQMDDDAEPEDVLLFSAHNGHYPYFDLFKNYYVVLGSYTKRVKYVSDIVVSTDRDLQLADKNNDGKSELYRKYFKDGKFKVDEKGNNLAVTWAYDVIEWKPGQKRIAGANESAGKIVLAYVTSWSKIVPDTEYITHINYAFGHVTNTFNGVRIDNPERLKMLVALKQKKPGLKVLLSIGGWGGGRFSEMAADENNRKAFAADCQRVVAEFALDGIDIDWEFPTTGMAKISASPDDTKNYTLMMQAIRDAIGRDKLLTLASSASAKYVDFAAINPLVDFVNIMIYDMNNPPRHHAPLFTSEMTGKLSGDASVQAHIQAGIPAGKLVFGIPFYGHGIDGIAGFIDYKKIKNVSGFDEKWDETAKVPYLGNKEGKLVCTYENAKSISLKCQYLLNKGMRGAMYWDYDGDDDAGTLRKAVYNGVMKAENQ